MKKKIFIVGLLSFLIIIISSIFIIFFSNRYNLVCTRDYYGYKQKFYILFDFFGKLENQVVKELVYFDTNEEAKNYKEDLINNYNYEKENIKLEENVITLYEYDIGIIQEDDSNKKNKKIKGVKKVYEEYGFTCKEVKK